ncbi:MAG: cystathionine beta-synthase [Flavobacteriales bacterium]|nr:cystathionine beta-synthase [Flavobacteriales bacterium]
MERMDYLKNVVANMPEDWLRLTTHRLDIYNEGKAKIEFLDGFEELYKNGNADKTTLSELPTAYDYIRLGHPLSSVFEWAIAKEYGLEANQVINFSSQIMPIMAVLRKNLFDNRNTLICYEGELPNAFNAQTIKDVYGYSFELRKVYDSAEVLDFDGSTIFIREAEHFNELEMNENIDFTIRIHPVLGSVILASDKNYVSEIQHVRRRESIAMTPSDSLAAIKLLLDSNDQPNVSDVKAEKAKVESTIKDITGTNDKPLIGSSGLSVQYCIMMGLVEDALENHPGKAIKFIVPPNCYGGTNDQARRVAACLDSVDIMDLPVDGDHDMVKSIDMVLEEAARQDAVPYIIAEIPTNPRVEVPNLKELRNALTKSRKTANGDTAIDPVFILDQTFCPNVQFLGEGKMLSEVRTISYASGSKFPSGGKCTAGYLVVNQKANALLEKLEKHLVLCDNEATSQQIEILAEQMPSMIQRIEDAYQNTRSFVNFIEKTLPEAKINFVSEELAAEGFTPSVFSLDLPTKGSTHEEREEYKRALNNKLIGMMIKEIPNESKYCVSYGQLKGCYWTIPATSTQGTTKEADKDYIARVSVSANLDLEKHKAVFEDFVNEIS